MRAVVSAMNAWSAECMGARILQEKFALESSWGGNRIRHRQGGCKMRSMGRIMMAVLLIAPAAALAQTTYRCTAKDGKKYYGQSIPPQCVGGMVEQLSASGTVMKRIDPQASADDRAKKEADEVERKKQETLNKEQARRDQALLATYGSEKDVEDMRRRALE